MIRIVPAPESREALERFARSIKELERAPAGEFAVVRQAIRHGFATNFAGEGVGGGPWAELSPYTVAERTLLGFPGEHPILERTGDYQASFVDPDHPDHVSDLEHGETLDLLEGTAHLYVGTHEYGRDDVFHVPARPVLLLSPENEEMIGAELDAVFDRLAQF